MNEVLMVKRNHRTRRVWKTTTLARGVDPYGDPYGDVPPNIYERGHPW